MDAGMSGKEQRQTWLFEITVQLIYSLYSPDLSMCHYDRIPKVKLPLRGKRFANKQDIRMVFFICLITGNKSSTTLETILKDVKQLVRILYIPVLMSVYRKEKMEGAKGGEAIAQLDNWERFLDLFMTPWRCLRKRHECLSLSPRWPKVSQLGSAGRLPLAPLIALKPRGCYHANKTLLAPAQVLTSKTFQQRGICSELPLGTPKKKLQLTALSFWIPLLCTDAYQHAAQCRCALYRRLRPIHEQPELGATWSNRDAGLANRRGSRALLGVKKTLSSPSWQHSSAPKFGTQLNLQKSAQVFSPHLQTAKTATSQQLGQRSSTTAPADRDMSLQKALVWKQHYEAPGFPVFPHLPPMTSQYRTAVCTSGPWVCLQKPRFQDCTYAEWITGQAHYSRTTAYGSRLWFYLPLLSPIQESWFNHLLGACWPEYDSKEDQFCQYRSSSLVASMIPTQVVPDKAPVHSSIVKLASGKMVWVQLPLHVAPKPHVVASPSDYVPTRRPIRPMRWILQSQSRVRSYSISHQQTPAPTFVQVPQHLAQTVACFLNADPDLIERAYTCLLRNYAKQSYRSFGKLSVILVQISLQLSHSWGRGGVAVRQLSSHHGGPGLIPDDATSGFLYVGILQVDAAGRAAPYSSGFTLKGAQDLGFKSHPNLFTRSLSIPPTRTYFVEKGETLRTTQARASHASSSLCARVIEVSMERRWNEGAGEMGDDQENPPTNDIVRHDSHLADSGEERYRWSSDRKLEYQEYPDTTHWPTAMFPIHENSDVTPVCRGARRRARRWHFRLEMHAAAKQTLQLTSSLCLGYSIVEGHRQFLQPSLSSFLEDCAL
ncbi:hypothetical protein PR048_017739 [Dryococelus australis]|uniref:Uncharacterized protein n=1 Tax=Dryococelus australis TaxID=614101 RepID=A0ABQ9HAB3_9NEOP|nr:hypothetical protein PR048_017739 [Dryococelus australis]